MNSPGANMGPGATECDNEALLSSLTSTEQARVKFRGERDYWFLIGIPELYIPAQA